MVTSYSFFSDFWVFCPYFSFAPRSYRYARKTVEQKQAGGLSHQGKRVQMKELSLRTSDRCHLWQSVSPLKCSNYQRFMENRLPRQSAHWFTVTYKSFGLSNSNLSSCCIHPISIYHNIKSVNRFYKWAFLQQQL